MSLPDHEESRCFSEKFDRAHKEAVERYNSTNEPIVAFPGEAFKGFYVTNEGTAGKESQGYSREITNGIIGNTVVVCTLE